MIEKNTKKNIFNNSYDLTFAFNVFFKNYHFHSGEHSLSYLMGFIIATTQVTE